MSCSVAVLAPMYGAEDPAGFNLDYVIRFGPDRQQLTLRALHTLAESSFRALPDPPGGAYSGTTPAAGYYLTGLLRTHGYDASLAAGDTDADLKEMARCEPSVVCISSTMLLSANSLKCLVRRIRRYMPEARVVVGGTLVWKSYCWFEMACQGGDQGADAGADRWQSRWSVFPCSRGDIDADLFVVSPHGGPLLLRVLEELDRGSRADLAAIENLAVPAQDGRFFFTRRVAEEPDYDDDFTRWDLLDELPMRIPIRTSVGCPNRCAYCDFHAIYPKLRLRSAESLAAELDLLRGVLRSRRQRALVSFVDDNAFSSPQRIREVCDTVIGSRINTYWLGFVHPRHIDRSNIGLIRRSGLIMAMVGVESGDPEQLRRMARASDIERSRQAIELLDAAGITALMYFVIGFPGEDHHTLAATAEFLNRLQLDGSSSSYQLYPLQVMPMSRLGGSALRERYQLTGMWSTWSHATMASHETRQAGRRLFDMVPNVPYHYEDESAWFNRRFAAGQRRLLFRLRNRLTRQLLDGAVAEVVRATLCEISAHLGYGDATPTPELMAELRVGDSGLS